MKQIIASVLENYMKQIIASVFFDKYETNYSFGVFQHLIAFVFFNI